MNLKKGKWIYANELYTTILQPHLLHYGSMIAKLYDRLREFYEVDEVIPTAYDVTNRKKCFLHRNIFNLDEILPILKSTFPQYNLTFDDDIFSFLEGALMWPTFVFEATGSNCVKHFFMKEKSVLIFIFSRTTNNRVCLSSGWFE